MQATKIRPSVIQQESPAACTKSSFISWIGEGLRCLLLFPALRVLTPVAIEGGNHIQGNGPYIFAANHSSHLDTPVLLAALPRHLRLRTHVAAAADYFFTSWWKGNLVRPLLNAFAFERQGPGCAASLLRARQFLAGGQSIVIFPEGTRAKDGELQRFKKGVGKLALATDAQVIPIWIGGTYAALPKGARWPRRQRITIRFGTPLTFAGETDPLSVRATIEQQVRALAMQTES